MKRPLAVGLALIAAGCAPARRLPPLALPATDSLRVYAIGPGLTHHDIWMARGPWAIQLLDVDRTCWSVVALKAGGQAVGRGTARELVQLLADTSRRFIGGGINADFFSFVPPGIPQGAHVSHGQVISGPFTRPALTFDRTGAPWTGLLATRGWVRIGGDSVTLGAWNQRRMPGVRLFDRRWGATTDTLSGATEVAVGGQPARVLAIDTSTAGISIPDDGVVLVADGDRLRGVRLGDPVTWQVSLVPRTPTEAVGGFPILLTDSALTPNLDSMGGAGFGPARHPRTAVGMAAGGRRLLLVVVDGRQLPFSNGMTLRELADLFLQLGASNAINLDGGGSSEMAVNRAGVMAIANRPSDAIERPVANALALMQRACRASR